MAFKDKFIDFPIIETNHLRLRQPEPGDAPAYFAIRTDPLVQRFTGSAHNPATVNDAEWALRAYTHHFTCKNQIYWAITQPPDNCLIGIIVLWNFTQNVVADIAYSLHPRFWGQGIMTEAVQAITRCGFEIFEFNRIQATILPANIASIRVVEKCGYMREGLLRQYPFGRGFDDIYMYSMLRRDLGPVVEGQRHTCTPVTFTDYRPRRKGDVADQ